MKLGKVRYAGAALALAAPLLLGAVPAQASGSGVSLVATGLNNPRGLHFGPDSQLYVAEGGVGGTTMNTVGQCPQVPPPVGPYTSDGNSGSISRVNTSTGVVTRVAADLPSSQTSLALGGLVSGVADVAFVKDRLYALISGAGCSHGLAGTNNAIVRVNADGSTTQVVNLSAFLMSHPVAFPEPSVPPGDFEPDGTWYGMSAKGGDLYALEPNHQEMDRIETANGNVSRVVDFSKTFQAPEDWRGPTAITRDDGTFYVGTLTPFPIVPGAAQVFKVTPGGHFELFAGGLTTVVGLAVDSRDRVYALEMSNIPGSPYFPTPFTGDVVRINSDGSHTTIAGGLNFPTAMTFGADGNLYVSNFGFGFPPGAGEVVRVSVPA
jgi:hypothetical protein